MASAVRAATAAPQLAWQLGLAVAVATALRSQALQAARIAHTASRDPAAAVHALRRTLRRLRALLRLLSDGLGRDRTRRARRALGQLARQLSTVRDAGVVETASRHLPTAVQRALPQQMDAWRRRSAKSHRQPALPAKLEAVASATQAITLPLAERCGRLRPRHLRAGLAQLFRRLERAVHAVEQHPRDRALHQLRKRGKDARHALEWLGVAPGDALQSRALYKRHRELVAMVRLLGDATDAMVMRRTLRSGKAATCQQRALRRSLRRQIEAAIEPALRHGRRAVVAHPKRLLRPLPLPISGRVQVRRRRASSGRPSS